MRFRDEGLVTGKKISHALQSAVLSRAGFKFSHTGSLCQKYTNTTHPCNRSIDHGFCNALSGYTSNRLSIYNTEHM